VAILYLLRTLLSTELDELVIARDSSSMRSFSVTSANIPVNQSVSVPCQNSGVGGSHGFFLTSFSHHLNEVQRSKPSRALQPPEQGTSLPPPSSLTLDSS